MAELQHEKCIALLQQAIDLLCMCSKWEDKAAMAAHKIGLQGEKRRDRYHARKDHMLVQYYMHLAYDLFGAELTPAEPNITMPNMHDIEAYLNSDIKKQWAEYAELHEIANAFVIDGYKPLSEPLYCHIACIQECIIELRRTLQEYTWSKSDPGYIYLSHHQVSNHNVHDKFEKKEEHQGYEGYNPHP